MSKKPKKRKQVVEKPKKIYTQADMDLATARATDNANIVAANKCMVEKDQGEVDAIIRRVGDIRLPPNAIMTVATLDGSRLDFAYITVGELKRLAYAHQYRSNISKALDNSCGDKR